MLWHTLMLSVLLALSQLLLTFSVGGDSLLSQGSRPDRFVPGLAAASEACSSSNVTDCRAGAGAGVTPHTSMQHNLCLKQ